MLSRRALLALGASALAAACRRTPPARRCAFCGMRVPPDSHWRAGGAAADGRALDFDTPGCLFRHLHRHGAGSVHNPWVVEYYGRATVRTPARRVRYAVGSDLVGPMGPDLVPIDPARVVAFTADHRPSRVLSFDEVTPAVVASLAAP